MKNNLNKISVLLLLLFPLLGKTQIVLLQDYNNKSSAPIGTFQGIKFREAGFSGLFAIPNTGGKEFWTVSDRGVNIDAANANPSTCRPVYDKIFSFPNYAPKIHRLRIIGDSVQILQTITIKRPSGTGATGVLNPVGFGSTALEVGYSDTVQNCLNLINKITAKDIWSLDSEGIIVDANGNFWICEENGPTIWKVAPNGIVINRYTPYAKLAGAQPEDVLIDTCFKYRKNNRGFEGISIAPNGKIYAIIQSPLLYPNATIGEASRMHRILEIDPVTNANRMFIYMNDNIIGTGSNQIRLKDWKIGDMAAVNDSTFLVLEAALRGTTDIKRLYTININGATPVTSGYVYSTKSVEGLDSAGLVANGIKPVRKTLLMNLLANSWPASLEKAEGLAIVNDSTIAICNDNDFGQVSVPQDGIAVATTITSHVFLYRLKGANKLKNFNPLKQLVTSGVTGVSTATPPYLVPVQSGVSFTSLLSAGDAINGYQLSGIPDGSGAFDNNDGTFTFILNHEMGGTSGIARLHGNKGAFLSKWIINKKDLSVISGADIIKDVYLWSPTGYTLFNASNISTRSVFNRFCSADLPAVTAFYNPLTGLGTKERIFMNGEENGSEGRAFAHIITGSAAGTTYELPYLGKFSWENAVANPKMQNKTIVMGTDDATPGQVYVYVGTKTNSGSDIDKAGLSNGKLYGITVSGLTTEVSTSFPAAGTSFTLTDVGNIRDSSGLSLNTISNAKGITNFLRPEDGTWDPTNLNDFYFATTNAFTAPSRLWKLSFKDINNPELGGTISVMLDGTEGQKMLDNVACDNTGRMILLEDVGSNVHNGKIWQYTPSTDALVMLGKHDPNRFETGASQFLTIDEETSGVFDAQTILGPGMFMIVDQAHYTFSSASPGVVEGGQILTMYNPETDKYNPEVSVLGNNTLIALNDTLPSSTDFTDFGAVSTTANLSKSFVIKNTGNGVLYITDMGISGMSSSEFGVVGGMPQLPIAISPNGYYNLALNFSPTSAGVKKAIITLVTSDIDETTYLFAVGGLGFAPGQMGPSTSQTPYLISTTPGVSFGSILTAGESVNGYKMCGTPDGIGAFDNNDGTFTMVMNHEFGNTAGVTRAHGSAGAFVSKWVINKSNLSVVSGSDLIKNVNLWNGTGYTTYNATNPSTKAAFNRFCSADLPAVSAFYNSNTGKGTKERLFMNGEEAGTEGRGFAHIVTGSNAGTSYELPFLGKFSMENLLACPIESDKTIVAGTDDATPGQVYFYIGTKSSTGNEIEKAGLVGGKLFGPSVTGLATEASGSAPAPDLTFTMVDLGVVKDSTGVAINKMSDAKSVTAFLRPEDGVWDPNSKGDFYFVTTNSILAPSRLWRMRFSDINNPEKGGTITALLDGTEGQKMFDNITIDNSGHLILLEDVGSNVHNGKVWEYTIATDALRLIGQHDPSRFEKSGANFLTIDEESSGVIDAQSILGPGMFLLVDQAHYAIAGEVVEGGQILTMYNQVTFNGLPEISVSGNNVDITDGSLTAQSADNTHVGNVALGDAVMVKYAIKNNKAGDLKISKMTLAGVNAADFKFVGNTSDAVYVKKDSSYVLTVMCTPSVLGNRYATVKIQNNDLDESEFDFVIQATGVTSEMTVSGNNVAVTNNDGTPGVSNNTDFGNVYQFGSATNVFAVKNSGLAPLKLISASVSGKDASDFTITMKTNVSVAKDSTTYFTIQFAPTSLGKKEGTVKILSSDLSSPYMFAISGNSVTPEISILGKGLEIASGSYLPKVEDNTQFGIVGLGFASANTFEIANNGTGVLSISSLSILGANAADFSIVESLKFPLLVDPKSKLVFNVKFQPKAEGNRSATVVLKGNDLDESTYDFVVSGMGLNTADVKTFGTRGAMAVQPNPSNEKSQLILNIVGTEVVTCKLMDIQGKSVLQVQLPERMSGLNTVDLNTSDLAQGVYFVEVSVGGVRNQIKLVVAH
ncbi:MAG: putative phytase [Bacteroidota bacterium]